MMPKRRALLIIDMQNASFPKDAPPYDTVGVIERINLLSNEFRMADEPVIIIQHDGTAQHEYIPGSWEWQIIDGVIVGNDDHFVHKTANDSFYGTTLHDLLAERQVTELFITGSATDFCVDATVQSALVKDYDVAVVGDAHTACNRPYLSADRLVSHYNWVWANLTPTKGSIRVVSAADSIAMFRTTYAV